MRNSHPHDLCVCLARCVRAFLIALAKPSIVLDLRGSASRLANPLGPDLRTCGSTRRASRSRRPAPRHSVQDSYIWHDFTAEFEFGLDLILDGLERFRDGTGPERRTAPRAS